MVIGTVTLSRRAQIPVRRRKVREQTIFEGGEHTVRARNKGNHWLYLTYTIKNLPRLEFEALDLYLTSPAGANYQGNDVTVVDDFGVSRTGRLVDKDMGSEEGLGRLYDVELTFRFPVVD